MALPKMLPEITARDAENIENARPYPAAGRRIDVLQKTTRRIITLLLTASLAFFQACDNTSQRDENHEQVRQERVKISQFLNQKQYEFPRQYSEEDQKRAQEELNNTNEIILFNDRALSEMVEKQDVRFVVVADIKEFVMTMPSMHPEQKRQLLSAPSLDSTNFIIPSDPNKSESHPIFAVILDHRLLEFPAALLAVTNYHLASLDIASGDEKDGLTLDIKAYERSVANLEKILNNLKNPDFDLDQEDPLKRQEYKQFMGELEKMIVDEKAKLGQLKSLQNK